MTIRRAELLLFLVTLLAALGWVFSKYALDEMSPFQFIAMRFLLASLVLLLFCYRQFRQLNQDQLLRSVLTGTVFGFTLLLWVSALQKTPFIGEGAFISSLTVVTVPIIGRLLFGSKLSLKLLVALVPAIAGLACLSLNQGFRFSPYQSLFLAATLGFSLHLNLSSYFVKNIPPMALAAIQLGMAGLIASVATLVTKGWVAQLSASAWGWLLCSALLATSLRFAIQTRALQTLMPSHASMIFLAEPVWTALLGALLLSERMSLQQWFGCVLIFTALIIFRGGEFVRYLLSRKHRHTAR
jgi:drug/metabolite transporter (DMT)-like permease